MTKKTSILFAAALLSMSVAGCKDSDEPKTPAGNVPNISFHMEASPRVGTDKNGADNEGAYILILKESDFHNCWMLGPDAAAAQSQSLPYFEVSTDKIVDSYTYASGNVFETRFAYPEDGTILHAVGLAPSKAFNFERLSTKGYTVAAVTSGSRNGKVDFLCCDGNDSHIGSYDTDPEYADKASFLAENHELKFRHLTSKVVVYGQRSPDTYYTVGVRDIKVTINDENIVSPTEFKLYTQKGQNPVDDQSTYVISATTQFLTPLYSRGSINMGEVNPLDSCYVVTKSFKYGTAEGEFNPFSPSTFKDKTSGTPQLKLSVKADLFVPGSEMAAITMEWPDMPVTWVGDVQTGAQLLPGYEYRIYLTFNRAGVALRAEAVPWQDGGFHVLPVTPKTNKRR